MRDGHLNPARVHKPPHRTTDSTDTAANTNANPAASGSGSPLVILIHGGGYCAGTYEQATPLARILARTYNATAITISHRFAPDHPFPTPAHDAIDAVAWLASHAADSGIGADTAAGFVVGGGSSGASLAGVAVQAWLDAGKEPRVSGVWLQMPSFLDPSIVPDKWKTLHFAREQNAAAPVLNAESLAYLKELYRADVGSALFSPVGSGGFLTEGRMMPRTYIMVCGMDPVRDDGLVYEKMLREKGVLTRLDVYAGVPHGVGLFAKAGLEKAKRAERDGVLAFGWLLGREVGVEEVQRAVDGA
ncbi:uncharacterized protein K452DRAFT_236425 [Aplosporella prunicola CBS 121167]|uniref:Alpha/beta hydrolase fold-3 domain-containing protein n=1 Tax=Aplosporella prunicola CBS 121167 TaxID=1176127 RepID=A0A6A6AZM7_9PEZI|nr:uncharacterized protein K452DRAFT_236425 [Aplosporella prunicola CBS 121167]KAF2137106.1 hypothetical protein K452DRAFT_236425 [Aplosporella prunicola CBS 121167]